MTLQKELKIFRFKNHALGDDKQKYDYQLFRNKSRVANTLSDNEFSMGKITIIQNSFSMDLIRNIQNINFREMEEADTYLIPITICF